jgi:hypothetical protein
MTTWTGYDEPTDVPDTRGSDHDPDPRLTGVFLADLPAFPAHTTLTERDRRAATSRA